MLLCLTLSLLLSLVQCKSKEGTTLSYAPFAYEETEKGHDHPTETVVERGLLTENVSQKDILDEYMRYSSQIKVKHSNEIPVLGFVTPWNNHGYDMAKLFNNKFTHISPCWLQIRRNTAGRIAIAGEQDIDKWWMTEVRSHCVSKCPYIVPRIVWEANGFSQRDLADLKRLLLDASRQYGFDGFVFEFGFSREILPLMKEIRSALEKEQIILVTHPEAAQSIHDGDAFLSEMNECVNYIVGKWVQTLQFTYPLHHVILSLDRHYVKESMRGFVHMVSKAKRREMVSHLMMGIPFYGYDGMNAITGSGYIEVLKQYVVEMKYHEKAKECAMRYVDEEGKHHAVYYPTLKFLEERIALAKKMKCGIAIWELGQGLDYFFDLL